MRNRSFSRWSVPASSVFAPSLRATISRLALASDASIVAPRRDDLQTVHVGEARADGVREREAPAGRPRSALVRLRKGRTASCRIAGRRARRLRCVGLTKKYAATASAAPAATAASVFQRPPLCGGGERARARHPRERRFDVQPRVARVAQAPPGILLEALDAAARGCAPACGRAAPPSPARGGGSRRRRPGPFSPVNARLPERVSKRMQPNAQMSVRRSVSLPRACSGLMNSGVPTISPGRESDMHERRGARHVAGKRQLHRLGQAEVEDLDLALGRDLDVRGLQVPVDDALLVRHLERLGDLRRDAQRVGDGERPGRKALRERFAGDELHDDVACLRRPARRRRSPRSSDG